MNKKILVLVLILTSASLTAYSTFARPAWNLLTPSAAAASRKITQGALQIVDPGKGIAAGECPLNHTDVKAEITGFIARTVVTQEFENPFNDRIEAVYTFPLPHGAAVDDMTMLVGNRTVRGKIKRREEAKAEYVAARQSGRVASLLDQERPNIFTQFVANIMPGEKVTVMISYVDRLKYEDGSYEFVFPMVVGPRYIPGTPNGRQGSGSEPDTTEVPDASRITPLVAAEGVRAGHDISIEVALDAGVPIQSLKSTLHEVTIERPLDRGAVVTLLNKAEIPNKDFILKYEVAGKHIDDAVLTHRSGDDGFFTMILQPPAGVIAEDVTPKELVFVLDTSGSMSGFPIEQAKECMNLALANLYSRDTFNLITFAGDTRILFPQPVPATPGNLAKAQRFLNSTEGGGGTEMMKAIRAALEPSDLTDHIRIVCFMTDGYVGDDLEIVSEVKKHPNARVFAFGIGNSVNRFLLDKMAEQGRGEVEYVTLQDDGSAAARRFHDRVRSPILTDISIDWGGLQVEEVYPKRIPDLFSARPIVMTGRYSVPGRATITVRGKRAGSEFSRRIDVELPDQQVSHDVLATLWARTKIGDLMSQDYGGIQSGKADTKVAQAITELGLRYRLMTQFTSFVAVEERPVTGEGEPTKTAVPVEKPEGVSRGAVSGAAGSVSETVSVTAESPVINTSDYSVGGVITRQSIDVLPLIGRNFLSLAVLEPGVTVSHNGGSPSPGAANYYQVSIGGVPQSTAAISVDGARTNDSMTGGTSQNFSSSAVQELQISTNGFDLSSRNVSGGAVNVVTRTGGNAFHGGGFLFFRDHNLAAYPGLARDERVADPLSVRKQYGGTIGGPIRKDQLFFFFNYERNSQISAQPVSFEDQRLERFSHVARQPQDGALWGGRIDRVINSRHSAFARGNIDANNGIAGEGLESTWAASSNFAYQTTLGLTSSLSSTLVNDFRFAYSYFRNRLRQPSREECESLSGDPLYCFGIGGPQITFFGGLTIGVNPNVSQDRHPRTYQWTDDVGWTKGSHRLRFGGNWEYSNGHGTWNRNAAGTFAAFSPEAVADRAPAIYNALPAGLKAGGRVAGFSELLRLPLRDSLTIGIGDPGQPAPYRYDDVLGKHHIRFYSQDNWQVFKRLVVNYGLGWSFENNIFYHDLSLPAYLKPLIGSDLRGPQQQHTNFDPTLGFAYGPGRKTVFRGSVSLHHTSPNLSLFSLNQRIFFGPAGNGLQAVSGAALPNPNAPGLLNFSAPGHFTLADMLAYLPTAKSLLAGNLKYNGTDLSIRGIEAVKTMSGLDAIYNSDSSRAPYTIHLNAGVQRELAPNLSLAIDYVMQRSVGFGAFEGFFPDLNRWNRFSGYALRDDGTADAFRTPIIPACTTAEASDAKAQCSNGPIQYGLPGILSRYSALHARLNRRFSNGFEFTVGYALSRYTTFSEVSNNDALHEGHGISSDNPRHRLTLSGTWALPKYKGNLRLKRALLNQWSFATMIEMRSATPTSITPGFLDVDGDGTFTFLLPGTTIGSFGYNLDTRDIRRLVDAYNATFPAARDTAVAHIGRANRDATGTPYPYIILPDAFSSGDSFLSHDLRVTRTLGIREGVKLKLIAEGSNLFNIANLSGFSGQLNGYIRPNGTTTGSNPNLTFGQPTGRIGAMFGSGGPRTFQLAARVSF